MCSVTMMSTHVAMLIVAVFFVNKLGEVGHDVRIIRKTYTHIVNETERASLVQTNSRLDTLEANSPKIQELGASLTKANGRLDALEQELSAALAKANGRLDTLEANSPKIQELNATLVETNVRLDSLDASLNQTSSPKIEELTATLTKANAHIEDLEKRVGDLTTEMTNILADYANLFAKVSNMET